MLREADVATKQILICEDELKKIKNMFYVYIIQSIKYPDKFYTGFTTDIKSRLKDHNLGGSIHTNKFKPWKLKNYFAFEGEQKAQKFELYLKTQSGRAFCKKHF